MTIWFWLGRESAESIHGSGKEHFIHTSYPLNFDMLVMFLMGFLIRCVPDPVATIDVDVS